MIFLPFEERISKSSHKIIDTIYTKYLQYVLFPPCLFCDVVFHGAETEIPTVNLVSLPVRCQGFVMLSCGCAFITMLVENCSHLFCQGCSLLTLSMVKVLEVSFGAVFF